MHGRAAAIHRLEAAGLADRARTIAERCCRLRSALTRRDGRLVARYFGESATPKLHIGSSTHLLTGWLNTDVIPVSRAVVHLDATRRFPLPDGRFRYAFSEHMIEHVPLAGAQAMLAECHRVLQPGGTLRISTPDLAFLVALHARDRSETQTAYIEWMRRSWLTGPAREHPDATAAVINHFMRAWGHRFIHDEASLRSCFERAGFVDVVRRPLNESAHPDLRGLENEGRSPAGFIALETLTLEGTRPATDGGRS